VDSISVPNSTAKVSAWPWVLWLARKFSKTPRCLLRIANNAQVSVVLPLVDGYGKASRPTHTSPVSW
jgi:hypothetical protein